jgi:hypothetical protein
MLQPLRRNAARQQISDVRNIPAPTWGWDATSSLATMKDDHAVALDNWFPTTSDVRVRQGCQVHCDDMGSAAVETLMVYNAVIDANSKMFAATDGDIYDVSVEGSGVISTVTGMSSNRWQWVNFATTAGTFLWICNGADTPRYFDGSAWATVAITGITEEDIIHVNAHKNRLWFVMKNSSTAAYLATGAIQGAATEFELGGLFDQGGYLVAMATWTLDGGSGQDDYAVFISSEGQCAVYQGTDPASADTWSLIGVFNLGAPLGRRCFTKVAGDVALINIDGVLPLSQALRQDRGNTQAIALSNRIQNAMATAARENKENFGWELTAYPAGAMAILNVPLAAGDTQHQYVMNTITGAWCRFIGMNANTWVTFQEDLYFGANDGVVCQADTGPQDRSEPIDAVGQTAYNFFSTKGNLKQWTMLQPLLSSSNPEVVMNVGLSTDFRDNASLSTPSAVGSVGAAYDEAVWDAASFGGEETPITTWTSVTGLGFCAATHFRVRTGNETEGDGQWGTGTWNSAIWSGVNLTDITLVLNGFNILFKRGAVL